MLEFCGYQLTQLSMTDTDRLDNIIKELQEARALMKNKKYKFMDNENIYFKKLSGHITREGHVGDTSFRYNYTYKFSTNQFLEQIDDLSGMSSYSYNEIKQIVIDQLTHEFRISLNSVVFGDAAGKDYVESIKNNQQSKEDIQNHRERKKSEEIFILMKLGNMTIAEINTLTEKERFFLSDAFLKHAKKDEESLK